MNRLKRTTNRPRVLCLSSAVSAYWRLAAVMILALSLMIAAFAGNRALAKDPLSIVTTIAMVGDITQNVAGDRADVIFLMGSGVDPHLYKATASDVRKLQR